MPEDTSTDISALGSVAPRGATSTKRVDPDGSFLRLALKNPNSEAAKILGVQNHALTDDQINELDQRVNHVKRQNETGMMSGIWDFIATAFQCLVGQFTDECGFKDFSKIKAGRAAMRTAKPIYEMLASTGADGLSSYAPLAEKISGVTPDGKGGYKPVLDANGQATGYYRATLDERTDPRTAYMNEQEDRGALPSKAQRERSEAIYKEELSKLYKDPEIAKLVVKYRPDPSKASKDDESTRFVNDPKVMKSVAAIADRIIADEQVKNGGSFKYSRPQVREQLIGRIKWSIAKNHKDNSKDIGTSQKVAEDKSPAMEEQLGQFPSQQFASVMPTTNSRSVP